MTQQMYTNRLAKEKSPYLLQHAHNPVDWFPWGNEAFEKARSENKPIFLSIGYSTCHWCHVMEEESFVNADIAKILNEHFVSVKVDREERPDVDHIYMQAVMALTGSGGWPMSVFLTPELKPFYGGTYFPPTDKWGRPGFVTVLNAVWEQWKNAHERIVKAGDDLTRLIQEETDRKFKGERATLNESTFKTAYDQLNSRFDAVRGGFGDAPKFPQGHLLSFLLRYRKRTGEKNALHMTEKTLDGMAKGGMYDQLAGGFHRYSTDDQWRVPHFEKMLYDQAILAKSYLEAYQATQKASYAQVAREIFDYVLRDMTDKTGGFYSAEDADSPEPGNPNQKSEGAFYIWSADEIEQHLGKELAGTFNFYFGVLPEGNAISDPHGEFRRKNILHIAHSLEETAEQFNKSQNEIRSILETAKKKLFTIRNGRPRPHLDDKVLTDWNGLMISALAFGSRVLNEPKYKTAAQKAADFILTNMVIASPAKQGVAISEIASSAEPPRNGKRLMHRYRDGHVLVSGFLEDYAFLIHGLLDLYEATFEERYLNEAKRLTREMIRLFWDSSEGGFFLSGRDSEALISRSKDGYDGAVPSGNSIAALCLLKLSRLTADEEFASYAQKVLDVFSHQVAGFPSAYGQMLIALDFALGPSREIAVAGKPGSPDLEKTLQLIYARFIPNKVVLLHSHASFLKPKTPLDGKTTVYICKNYACDLPITDLSKLEDLLDV